MGVDVTSLPLRIGLAGATAAVISLLLTPILRALAVRAGWVGKPFENRWDRRVIARSGGIAMFLAFLGAAAWWVPMESGLARFSIGVSLVFLLGLVDDLHRLPPYAKLIAQLLIGCVVVLSGIRIELIQWPWLAIPLTILWVVLIMNAFNLLDNMDGLAAGIGAVAAAFYVIHAVLAQQWTIALLGAIIGGSCLGFLWFNFPPAKIYMGDSGSHFLGLSLAVLALLGSWRHSTQLLSVLAVPVLVLAVPIFDTCFVTIERLLHHRHPFIGGKDHVSHRLAILGLGERKTVTALYGVSACLGLLSVVSTMLKPLTALALWLSVVTGLMLFGRYLAKVNVYRLEPHADEPTIPEVPGEAVTFIETMLLHKRRLIEILVDFALVCSVYVFAHLLRFEGVISGDLQQLVVRSLPLVLLIKFASFAGCGLYRGVWRYLGLSDLLTVFKAVTLGSILSALALLYLWRFEGYSRAVFIIDWMLSFLAIGGSRVAERLLDIWIRSATEEGVPVLIIGAGDTGELVLRYLQYKAGGARRVVGFLDDDPRTHGNLIHGTPVLGGRARLAELIEAHQVKEVLIAISDPPGELLQEIRGSCEPLGIVWKVVTAGVTDAV